MKPKTWSRGWTVALVVALTLAACGGEGGTTARTDDGAAVETPTRIVSLSPTATEMLFEIGAGPQVVAVDDHSDYPPDAPRTAISAQEPNVEAIAGHEPDLVVIADSGGELAERLDALEIRVVQAPPATTLEEAYEQVEELGAVTGRRDSATRLVARIRRDLAALVASVPPSTKGRTYYHELDPSYFTVTSKTFIGSIYTMLGLRNIADPADVDASGYPQLSAEFILRADPELIFLADADCCQQSLETVAARSGWSELTAVRTGQVFELDDDVASRWGPRVVDFAASVVEAVTGPQEAP